VSGVAVVFRRRRWWRSGACGACAREPVEVTWVGAVPDETRPTHRHVFVCEACVAPYDQPERDPEPVQEPDPEPERPAPVPVPPPAAPPISRTERWLHVANTALSCLAVIFAAAAFCIAQGAS
jgi:hypothetical protein